jgi:hypothetical protein
VRRGRLLRAAVVLGPDACPALREEENDQKPEKPTQLEHHLNPLSLE